MVKKLLHALVGLSAALSAMAGAAPKPPDVPAYSARPITYAAGTTSNVLGDGSSNSGTPPAASIALTDIPTTEAGWLTTGGGAQPLTLANGGSAPEAKFRSIISGGVKVLFDDPIRNYGQPGASHCHEFFGNLSANAYSTFVTLRNQARQYAMTAGGPKNGTAYWFPCMIDTATGKVVTPVGNIVLYYTSDPYESPKISPLYLGLRYVVGANMDDPNETWLQAYLNTANAQSGTAGRYQLMNGSERGYSKDWKCTHTADSSNRSSKFLKNANGTDPFGGNCTSGDDLWMQFVGSDCWDGWNLWSDGGNAGYRHIIPTVWDTVKSKWVCPNGWYKIPALVLQIHFSHTGFSDYGNWRLSSDDMMQAKLTALGTPRAVNNGESFHTDWFGGWDLTTLNTWLAKCIGVGILSGARQAQCDSSAIDDTSTLVTGAAPTGRSPQVQGGNGSRVDVSTQHNGPATIHVHGGM